MNGKGNLGIIISIFAGVLILLTAYLLIDLHVIDFGSGEEEEDNSVIIDDNPPIGPTITNETVSPVVSDGNETETVVEDPKPQQEQPEQPKKETEKPQQEQQQQQQPQEQEEQIDTKGTISYDEDKYECYVGDSFAAVISASYVQSINKQSHVKSYSSSNNKIATVSKHPSLAVNCVGCVAVEVKCLAEGKTTLKATSDTGATTSVNITVKKVPAGTISFSKTSFECVLGQKLGTDLKVTSSDINHLDSIKSYKSNDTSIASLTLSELQPNCYGCIALNINCLKVGTTTLTATSSNGASVTTNVTVKQDLGKISFDKTSYTCTEGDLINAVVTASPSNNNEAGSTNILQPSHYPTNITSESESMVSIGRERNQSYGDGKENFTIYCNKAGKTEITAVANTGATVKAPVTVKAASSSVTYSPSSISCTAGKTVSVQVTFNPARGYDISMADTSIASYSRSSIQFNCTDCVSLDIKCLKKGSTTLKTKLINGYEKTLNITVK